MTHAQPVWLQILNQLIYFASGLCLLTAVGNLVQIKRQTIHYIHTFMLVCNGLLLLRLGLYGKAVISQYPITSFFFATSLFLIGPLNLIYNHYLIDHNKPLPKSLVYQLIPGAIVFLLEIGLQFLPVEQKQVIVQDMLYGPLQHPGDWLLVVGALSLLGYHCVILVAELSLGPIGAFSPGLKLLLVMNLLAVLSISLTLGGYLAVNVLIIKFSGGLYFVIYAVDFLSRSRYPDFFQNIQREIKQRRYTRALKQGLQPDVIYNRLEELMRDEQAFREPELSLDSIANRLGIKPHQLSQILNDHYHTTFKHYLNTYRIAEARRLLAEAPDATILFICYESGFSSKSHFNTVFKEMTGETPGAYRNRVLGTG